MNEDAGTAGSDDPITVDDLDGAIADAIEENAAADDSGGKPPAKARNSAVGTEERGSDSAKAEQRDDGSEAGGEKRGKDGEEAKPNLWDDDFPDEDLDEPTKKLRGDLTKGFQVQSARERELITNAEALLSIKQGLDVRERAVELAERRLGRGGRDDEVADEGNPFDGDEPEEKDKIERVILNHPKLKAAVALTERLEREQAQRETRDRDAAMDRRIEERFSNLAASFKIQDPTGGIYADAGAFLRSVWLDVDARQPGKFTFEQVAQRVSAKQRGGGAVKSEGQRPGGGRVLSTGGVARSAATAELSDMGSEASNRELESLIGAMQRS